MHSGKFVIILLLVALVTALSGCTSPAPTPSPAASVTPTNGPMASPSANPAGTPTPAPQTKAVTIRNSAFDPQIVEITAGGSVTWTNQDGTAHTVKFSDSESPSMGNGANYTKTFDSPGKYDYICGIHPFMKGTVEVS
jgi:Plastocyanin